MKKTRIDILLVEEGFADTRSKAQRLVMAGQVRVDGQIVEKPSMLFSDSVEISVDPGQKYVSRGGEKLEAALTAFRIEVRNLICADVGSSTGGFTDCLLQHGASRIYCIDVGKGILHWKLRQNEKVVLMEGTNARSVEKLAEGVNLVTVDASFISSKILLPIIQGWFKESMGQVILLIKPQFEAGRSEVSRGKGVIRDPRVHEQVLLNVLTFAQESQYQITGLIRSPLLGPKGNLEFLAWLTYPLETEVQVKDFIQGQILT